MAVHVSARCQTQSETESTNAHDETADGEEIENRNGNIQNPAQTQTTRQMIMTEDGTVDRCDCGFICNARTQIRTIETGDTAANK